LKTPSTPPAHVNAATENAANAANARQRRQSTPTLFTGSYKSLAIVKRRDSRVNSILTLPSTHHPRRLHHSPVADSARMLLVDVRCRALAALTCVPLKALTRADGVDVR
jgi:hypothetical protein